MTGEPRSDSLENVLREIENGTVVIPEFQRDFVWDPEQVRQLLVSVLAGYHIGTIILINQVLYENRPFEVRPIKGVNKTDKIVRIILDGQQRLTSLYYAKNKPGYPLKGRLHPHVFFIDLRKAKRCEWDEAVIAVSVSDRGRLNALSSDPYVIEFSDLFRKPSELLNYVRSRTGSSEYADFALDLATKVKEYKISIYGISKDTPSEVIVETFERINRLGTRLTIFDLLVAKLYKDNIKLRDLFKEASGKYEFIKNAKDKEKLGEYIIKMMVLVRGNQPSRKYMLSISSENFVEDWNNACKALELAYRRVCNVHSGYGVINFEEWMPYETMLVPMASAIHYLRRNNLDTEKNYKKLDVWYWVSVFGGRYEHSSDAISKQDYDLMIRWFHDDNAIPHFIKEFDPRNVDYDVKNRRSAIYKGVISLIVLKGAKDFITGQPPEYEKEKIQLDHIFPVAKFKRKYGKELDSVLNRTVISSNQRKLDKKPSEFFRELLNRLGEADLLSILETHLIPKEAFEDLLSDNFEGFKEKRESAIINEIRSRIKI